MLVLIIDILRDIYNSCDHYYFERHFRLKYQYESIRLKYLVFNIK